MAKEKNIKVTPVGGASAHAGVSIPKHPKDETWCKGTIWFDENGCLHIEDTNLGTAVLNQYLESGRLCISVKTDFSPQNNLNLQCAC